MQIIVTTFAHHLLTDSPVFIEAKKIINHYLISSNKITLIADTRKDKKSLELYEAITDQSVTESNKLSVCLIGAHHALGKDNSDIQKLITDLNDTICSAQKQGIGTVIIIIKHHEPFPSKKITVHVSHDPPEGSSGFHFTKRYSK